MKISHILVPSDLSYESLRPCEAVSALASALGARITLLHVAQDLPLSPMGVPYEPVIMTPDLETRMETALSQLEEQKHAFQGVDVSVDVVPGSEVVRTIVDYAKDHDVDLIAISTHGRTGFRHLLLGSVAEAVVRRSPVPVVTFPLPKPAEKKLASQTA